MSARENAGSRTRPGKTRLALTLLCGTVLGGMPVAAFAQDAAPAPAGTPTEVAPQTEVIRTIAISGAQRLEPNTILSYIRLRPGQVYTQAAADQALKDLYATELFSSASIANNGGALTLNGGGRASLDAEISYSTDDGPSKPIPSGKGKRLARPGRPKTFGSRAR